MKQSMLAMFCYVCFALIANSQVKQTESAPLRKSKTEFAKPTLSQEVLMKLFDNNVPVDFPKADQYTSNEVYFKVTQGYLNVNPGTFNKEVASSLGFVLSEQSVVNEPVSEKRKVPTRLDSYTDAELNAILHPELRKKYTDEQLFAMSREERLKLNNIYYNSYELVASPTCSISDKDQVDISKYEYLRKSDERVKITIDASCGSYIVLYGLNEFSN